MLEEKRIDAEKLEQVTGGGSRNNVSEECLIGEFDAAWIAMCMDTFNISGFEKEKLYDKWTQSDSILAATSSLCSVYDALRNGQSIETILQTI